MAAKAKAKAVPQAVNSRYNSRECSYDGCSMRKVAIDLIGSWTLWY